MTRDVTLAFAAVTADPVTTWLAVNAGATEAHPLWARAIGNYGLGPAMTLRFLIGIVLIAALAVAIEHDGSPVTAWTLRALTAVFAIVALWNLAVWRMA